MIKNKQMELHRSSNVDDKTCGLYTIDDSDESDFDWDYNDLVDTTDELELFSCFKDEKDCFLIVIRLLRSQFEPEKTDWIIASLFKMLYPERINRKE